MNEQKNQRDGQPLPQGEFQEIEAQELDAITGGTPLGQGRPHTYQAQPTDWGAQRAIVYSHDHSAETKGYHSAAMDVQKGGTVWQHVPVVQPDGTIAHTYHDLLPRSVESAHTILLKPSQSE